MDEQEGLRPLAEDLLRIRHIGIEDRLGVITVERKQVDGAKGGRQVGEDPEASALEAVDDFVDERVAHQLELLRAWRGDERHGTDALRMSRGEFERGDTTVALTNHVILRNAVARHEGGDDLSIGFHRVIRNVAGRTAKAGHERLDDGDFRIASELFAELRAAGVPRDAMEVDDDVFTKAGLDE